MTERPKSKFLQFLLAKDEIITTKFVTFLLNYEPFRAIKAHTKALELSCDDESEEAAANPKRRLDGVNIDEGRVSENECEL
ncbi:hypothetical protein GQX74_005648 [Glossina fuscipes]|nr:hypothetical protein GQX74_005648 [Glossina fuscipes]